MNGRKIKTYSSAAEAERATGIFATSIRNAASGGGISAGGFAWRWGKKATADIKTVRQEKRIAYIKKYGQRLTQYDLSGKRIAHYPSVKDAAEASGTHATAIYNVLNGKYKSANRFFWTKGYGKKSIDLSKHKWGRESMAITQSKPVKKYSRDGRYLQTFPSIKLAARSIGLHPSTVIDALRGRQHTSGGFKWKYANPVNR